MAINNPYIPGDPYSYDLKWIVAKIKEILQQLGTLDEAIEKKIFEGFLEHSVVQFHNVPEMLAADLTDNSIVLTLGYHEAGDLGGLFYLIKNFNPGQCALDYFLTLDNNAQIAIPVVTTPYVTPEMFGAYGDGVNNDTDAFKVVLKNYHDIELPNGKTYYIDDTLELIDDQIIHGTGTILDRFVPAVGTTEPVGLLEANDKKNIIIDQIKVKGTGAGGSGILLQYKEIFSFNECKNITVQNCMIEDTNAVMCIRFNECIKVSAINNTIERYSYSGIANVQGSDDLLIDGNRVIDCMNTDSANTYPITLHSYEITTTPGVKHGNNLVCVNNYIYNSEPHWECIDAHGGNNIIVSNNVCDNAADGIAVFSDADRYFYAKHVTISNNIINGATVGTVRTNALAGITGAGEDFTITGNILTNCAALSSNNNAAGMYMRQMDGVLISDNIFGDCYGHAITIAGYTKNLVFKDNIIRGLNDNSSTDTGYAIYFVSGRYGDVTIRNNELKGITRYFILPPAPVLDTGYVPHIRYYDNMFNDMSFTALTMFPRSTTSYCVPQFMTGIPSNQQGMKGDIVLNVTPGAGQPYGWVCTSSYDGNTNATWVALPTL